MIEYVFMLYIEFFLSDYVYCRKSNLLKNTIVINHLHKIKYMRYIKKKLLKNECILKHRIFSFIFEVYNTWLS